MGKKYLATQDWVNQQISASGGLPSLCVYDDVKALADAVATADDAARRFYVHSFSSSSISSITSAIGPISFGKWRVKGFRTLRLNVRTTCESGPAGGSTGSVYLSTSTSVNDSVAAIANSGGSVTKEYDLDMRNYAGTYYFVLSAGGSPGYSGDASLGGWTIAP